MEVEETVSAEEAKKKRIESYRSTLNYFKGKALTLETMISTKKHITQIPNEVKTMKELDKNTKELHDGIMLMLSLRQCVNLIQNTLTRMQVLEGNDHNTKTEIMNKMEGIIHFSKSIMKLYDRDSTELDIIEKKKSLVAALTEFGKHLESMKNGDNNMEEKDPELMEKAELLVYKINLIRTMKAVLIGFIATNYPSALHQFESMQCATKRNLTVDDFIETWDYGLNT